MTKDEKAERLPTGSKYKPYYTYMNEDESVKKQTKEPEERMFYENEKMNKENEYENTKPEKAKSKKKKGWLSRNKILVSIFGLFILAIALLFAAAFFTDDISGLGPKIAVINIHGTMITGEAPYGTGYSGSDTVCGLIRKAVDKDNVDAIILRVNSGGGSGSAADEIVFELKRAKEKGIPIVTTMGDAGASAAYWVASQSDYIFVTNSTITGSIGAIGMHEDHSKMHEIEGINVTVFKSGPYKDMGSTHRPLTDEEKLYWQQIVDDMKNNMVREVSEGRNLDEAYVQTLADGRIYTGQKAIELNLADGIGNFYTAVDKVKEMLNNYEEPNIMYVDSISITSLFFGFDSVENQTPESVELNPENESKTSNNSIREIKYPTVWMEAFLEF